MENNNRRLKTIMNEINDIYSQSIETLPLQTKIENYNKGMILIRDAKELIDQLQKDIATITIPTDNKISKDELQMIEKYSSLLESPGLEFGEILKIVDKIKEIGNGIAHNSQIHDNIQNEVLYVEEEIEDF